MKDSNSGYKREKIGENFNVLNFLLLIVCCALAFWNYKISGDLAQVNESIKTLNLSQTTITDSQTKQSETIKAISKSASSA